MEILRRHLEELIHEKKNEDFIFASKIKDLEGQLWKSDVQRRKLHNLVQELRGNVRVFARVRPLLPTDETDNYASTVLKVAQNDTGIKIARRTNEMSSDKSEEHLFNFDRVFGPSVSQEMVFNEVSEFVQSALDGYNVCLFSYGQTGSGKTHTMLGTGYGDSPMRGIIPRAIEQIGKYKQGLESKGWTYQMEASFIEIYNENIKDLLRSTAKDDLKHEIKKDPSGFTVISDTTLINVNPCDQTQIQQILLTAARQRSVGSTAMNANSSRSHSIFTLYLRAANETEGLMLNGCLNLVDLAGSERLDKSQAMGDRLKEAVAINKSLSSLTDVFLAISNKQSHVPFRNSKLTHFLQPSLSGDGKTLMIINLSPVEESYFETLCTLRFGSQVNQCELGKPKRMLGQPVNSNSSTVNATGTSKQCSNPKRKVSEKEVTISKR